MRGVRAPRGARPGGRDRVLDRVDDLGVQGPASIEEQTPVRHVVYQRVFEGVLEMREQTSLVEELPRQQVGEAGLRRFLWPVGDALEQAERHVLADDRGRLQEPLILEREPVDPRGQDRLRRRRYLKGLRRLGQTIGSALAHQGLRLDEGADALLEKEGVPSSPLDQQALEGRQSGIVAQQALEQLVGALGRQGIDAELPVIGLATPAVLILRAIVDEEKQSRGGQAIHQAVEERLGFGIDPVQILEQDHDRLHLALTEQQALAAVEGPLTALGRLQLLPLAILDAYIPKPQERRRGGFECPIEGKDLARELLPDLARLIARLDLEIGPEQVDDGEKRRRLTVGDGAALNDPPAFRAIPLG